MNYLWKISWYFYSLRGWSSTVFEHCSFKYVLVDQPGTTTVSRLSSQYITSVLTLFWRCPMKKWIKVMFHPYKNHIYWLLCCLEFSCIRLLFNYVFPLLYRYLLHNVEFSGINAFWSNCLFLLDLMITLCSSAVMYSFTTLLLSPIWRWFTYCLHQKIVVHFIVCLTDGWTSSCLYS